MIVTGLVLAVIAALLHVYIFYMESIAWESARVRTVFGTSEAEAAATKQMAFNQGFYNLFLAIVTVIGVVLHFAGHTLAGMTLILSGLGSMSAAALVLLVSSPDKRPAALKQGTVPFLGVLVLTATLIF